MSQVKLLCFDLDGTLIDSVQDIAQALNQVLQEYGAPTAAMPAIRASIGEGPLSLLQKIAPDLAHDPLKKAAFTERFLQVYALRSGETTTLFDGAYDFLKDWTKISGNLIGLITNKSEYLTHQVFKQLALDQLSWVGIYGADTWPEKKPSPMPLYKMMAKAGVTTQQTIMIGDGTPDVASAQAAGVRSIAMEFGYTSTEILKKYKPVAFLNDYKNLMSLVASLD
jgi:phosphoglycolate phosphatase